MSEKLRDLITSYKYGQENLLEANLSITLNPTMREMHISPFYQHGMRSKVGTCAELMSNAYKDIGEQFPELDIIRATGTEPQYFPDALSAHCYLILSEENLMGDAKATFDNQTIKDIISTDPLVADPSLGKVLKYSESGYKVHRLYGPGYPIEYSNDCILTEGQYVPIHLSFGELVLIGGDFSAWGVISFGFRKKGYAQYSVDLCSRVLDRKAKKDPMLERYVRKFRNCRPKTEYEPFIETEIVEVA